MDLAITILLWAFAIIMVNVTVFMTVSLFALIRDAIFGSDDADESESK